VTHTHTEKEIYNLQRQELLRNTSIGGSTCIVSLYMCWQAWHCYKLTGFFPLIRVPSSFDGVIILYFFYIPHLICLIRSWIYLILFIVCQRPFLKFLPKCSFCASIVCDFRVSCNKLIKFHKTCKSWIDTRANTVRCLLVLGVLSRSEILSVTVSAAKQRASPHICWYLCVSSRLFRK